MYSCLYYAIYLRACVYVDPILYCCVITQLTYICDHYTYYVYTSLLLLYDKYMIHIVHINCKDRVL